MYQPIARGWPQPVLADHACFTWNGGCGESLSCGESPSRSRGWPIARLAKAGLSRSRVFHVERRWCQPRRVSADRARLAVCWASGRVAGLCVEGLSRSRAADRARLVVAVSTWNCNVSDHRRVSADRARVAYAPVDRGQRRLSVDRELSAVGISRRGYQPISCGPSRYQPRLHSRPCTAARALTAHRLAAGPGGYQPPTWGRGGYQPPARCPPASR